MKFGNAIIIAATEQPSHITPHPEAMTVPQQMKEHIEHVHVQQLAVFLRSLCCKAVFSREHPQAGYTIKLSCFFRIIPLGTFIQAAHQLTIHLHRRLCRFLSLSVDEQLCQRQVVATILNLLYQRSGEMKSGSRGVDLFLLVGALRSRCGSSGMFTSSF